MLKKTHQIIREQLWAQMLAGMVLGILVGMALSPYGMALVSTPTAFALGSWIAVPGALFMALIKMIVIPLVFCSITLAITSSGNMNYLKSAGWRIALYFVGTTTAAVTIGIFLANLIEPGSFIDPMLVEHARDMAAETPPPAIEVRPDLPKLLIGLLPTNPMQAVVDRSMLQIVIGAILVGIALLSIKKTHAKPTIDLCASIQELSMVVVSWAMWIAPAAVFSFLCSLTINMGMETVLALSTYMVTVLTGLLILLVVYTTMVAFIGRRCPRAFLGNIRNAQILAFSTSSSAATMPLTMETAEKKLGVQKEISEFIVPLGTTINMDGTALYQIIAAVFLTQVFGITLEPGELVLLAVTIVGASIGSPGSPGVGLVILATILHNIGVPPAGVALILGVDRILDMCRTTINVTGDLTACVIMEKWLGKTTAKTLCQ